MKRILTALIFLLAAGVCFASPKSGKTPDWTGRVLDENGEPIPYVTVAVLNKADSTIVNGAMTDENGAFRVVTDAKDGLLMVALLGYDTQYVGFGQDITVRLQPTTVMLGEAVVKAEMPKVKLTGEGIQTNIRGSVLENIGTANDALSRTPGVIKTKDGLQVLGKGAPIVYVNGRKLADITELDRIQSHEIQNIEVISNPGAQYDASVGAVIRIRTIRRDGEGFGFNTGLAAEQSLRIKEHSDPSGYFNFNYRKKNFDLFAGVSAYTFHMQQSSELFEETFTKPSFLQKGPLEFTHIERGMSDYAGFNWQIADNHSIGVRLDHKHNFSTNEHQDIYTDIYKDGDLMDHIHSHGENGTDTNPGAVGINAYYNGQVGKLNIDFNADYYNTYKSSDNMTEEHSEFAEDAVVNVLSHSKGKMYAAKLILSYPIWQGTFSLGTEDVFSRRHEDYAINSALLSNTKSSVKEDNIAAFASYAFYAQKFGQLNVGLRYEHVNYDYIDEVGTGSFGRKYDNLFPSLSYANQFGPVQVMFSYRARTIRPSFSQLDGTIRYHSRFIYQSGNPKLQPQTSQELNLTGNWKFLTFVAQYARIDNTITQWSELYNDTGACLSKIVNLEKPYRTLACYVNATPTIGVWTLNYTAGVQQQWLTLPYEEATTSQIKTLSFNDRPMWIVQAFNTFRFKGGWQFELGAEYHSKGYSQNSFISNNFLDLSAAIQKTFLPDGSLVLRLEGGDLARMARYNVEANCGNHIIRQSNLMDDQRIKLRLTYRFNAAKSKYRGTGAGSDTKGRM